MRENEEMIGVERLLAYLVVIQPGQITATDPLGRLLAASWNELDRDDGGMEGYKLLGRIEDVTWQPPKLTFTIERHGGTVMGSARAELQHWEVNVEQKTAVIVKCGHRQVQLAQTRLDVGSLAEEIAALIINHQDDVRLQWCEDGCVKILVGKILPARSAVKQTLAGRRKRFRQALYTLLCGEGWQEVKVGTFKSL